MPKDMRGVMQEFKNKKLHSGSSKGPVVSSRKQAIAIGLSEQRQQGKAVKPAPRRKPVPKKNTASPAPVESYTPPKPRKPPFTRDGAGVHAHGTVSELRTSHDNDAAVHMSVKHGKRSKDSPYFGDETRVQIPASAAKQFHMGQKVRVSVHPHGAKGQPQRTNDAAPKAGTRTASAKGKSGGGVPSAIRAAFGK